MLECFARYLDRIWSISDKQWMIVYYPIKILSKLSCRRIKISIITPCSYASFHKINISSRSFQTKFILSNHFWSHDQKLRVLWDFLLIIFKWSITRGLCLWSFHKELLLEQICRFLWSIGYERDSMGPCKVLFPRLTGLWNYI